MFVAVLSKESNSAHRNQIQTDYASQNFLKNILHVHCFSNQKNNLGSI